MRIIKRAWTFWIAVLLLSVPIAELTRYIVMTGRQIYAGRLADNGGVSCEICAWETANWEIPLMWGLFCAGIGIMIWKWSR